MTSGFTTRARAERFAAALDAPGGSAPLGVDPAWVQLVGRLQAVPEVQPRPEFSAALREQLLVAARAQPAVPRPARGGTTPEQLARLRLSPTHPRAQRRLTAAVAGLALVGAGGGMALASQSALPGDTLYPVKRAIEDVRTGLEDDPSARGTRLIGQARDRLTEVAALSVDDGADPAAVARTLVDFSEQAGAAGEAKLEAYYSSGSQDEVLELRGLATDALGVLGSLEPAVPATARPALLSAAQDLRALDAAARQACGGCGGPVVGLVPELALDPSSADLGRALGLPPEQAGAGPDSGPGARDRSDGSGTTARAGSGTGSGTGSGDPDASTPAGGGDGRPGGAGRPQQLDGQPDGAPAPSVGQVPAGSDDSLRDLARDVGEDLGGLAGSRSTSLQRLAGGLFTGAGTGPDGVNGVDGDGARTDRDRTTGKGDGRAGRTGRQGGTGAGPAERPDVVDDTLGGLLP